MNEEALKINVCVILAVCNGENYIEQQLKTILWQEKVKANIYISDDCSIDNSIQICSSLQSQYNQIKIINQTRKLGGAARNFLYLLKEVDFDNYDYVALSDQDDIWNADKLKHAISKMCQHNVDAYSSNVTAFWLDGKHMLIDKAQPQTTYDYMFESAGPGCTFVISKKLVIALQIFLRNHEEKCNAIALHDWFIYAFARLKGFQWFIDAKPSMMYRQHDNNVIGANRGIKPMFTRLNKLKQGWYRKQTLLIATILGYAENWPIKHLIRLNVMDRIKLALNARHFRRRLRDQFAFAAYILLFAKK